MLAIVSPQQVAVILASNVVLASSGCCARAGVFSHCGTAILCPECFVSRFLLLIGAGALQCCLLCIVVLQQVGYFLFFWF